MKLGLAARLAGKKTLPSAISALGSNGTGFLVGMAPECVLSPTEMLALVKHFSSVPSLGPSETLINEVLLGTSTEVKFRWQPTFCRRADGFLRDLCVFSFSAAKWRFDEIEPQLSFMGLPPLKNKAAKCKVAWRIRTLMRRLNSMGPSPVRDCGNGWGFDQVEKVVVRGKIVIGLISP